MTRVIFQIIIFSSRRVFFLYSSSRLFSLLGLRSSNFSEIAELHLILQTFSWLCIEKFKICQKPFFPLRSNSAPFSVRSWPKGANSHRPYIYIRI
jgi:hypothetical protein